MSFHPFAEISELLTQLAIKADLVVIQGMFSKQPVEQRHPYLGEGQGQDFDFLGYDDILTAYCFQNRLLMIPNPNFFKILSQ